MGVSGSGKTTVGQALASHLQLQFFDGDDFHSPANKAKMASGLPLTDRDREPWLETLAELMAEKDCILACSSLKKNYRKTMAKDMKDEDKLVFIYLKGSQEVIERRLTNRQGHYFKAELLQSQFDALEAPTEDENAVTVNCDENIDIIVETIVEYIKTK